MNKELIIIVAAFLAAVLFAGENVAINKRLHHIHPMFVLLVMHVVVVIAVVIAVVFIRPDANASFNMPRSSEEWAILVLCGIAFAFGEMLYIYAVIQPDGLKYAPSMLALVPIMALCIKWWLYGAETFNWQQLVGYGLAVIAIFMITYFRVPPPPTGG